MNTGSTLSNWLDSYRNASPELRQRILIILTSVIVGLWIGDRFILTPLMKSWRERSARMVSIQRTISEGRQLLERESSVRDRWEQMKTNALPSAISQAEGRMLSAFDRWSRASQISVTSIKPQWKRPAEDHATLECRVDASGSLSAVTRFLFEIENDPLAMKIEIVELGSRDSTGALLTLGLQVSGLVLQPEERQ